MSGPATPVFAFGPFRLDPHEQSLLRDGDSVSLTPKAFELLLCLVEHSGRLVRKEELLEMVWPGTFVEEAVLSVNMSSIRKALGDDRNGHTYIETVPRRGYRFVAPVTSIQADAAHAEPPSREPQAASPFVSRRRAWLALAAVAVVFVLSVALARWFAAASAPIPTPAAYLQITAFPDSATQPALSADGRMLTFVRGNGTFFTAGQVYVKRLPDGEPLEITHDDQRKMSPVFSPDGSRIAYTTVSPGDRWDTWTVPVLGGAPTLWLLNTSGLVWTSAEHLLFSEIKAGQHMGIAAAREDRTAVRDVYLPSHTRAMAHHSYLSPDGKWVLLVEMDGKGAWIPCRVVPFDASSAGTPVGPPGAPCTSGAWSLDGKSLYLSVFADGNFHIWREHFPGGRSERVTSGPTEEEGIAMAPDGRSFITSVGFRQRTVSIHDASGDRQISTEGYAYEPTLSGDGRKLYYRILKGGGQTPSLERSELWVADIESGRNELLLRGFSVTGYDISRDGRRVVFAALDSAGTPQLWLAATDHRSAPRAIPNADGVLWPHFGLPGEVVFVAADGARNFVFRSREDGGGKQKLSPTPVDAILGMSLDNRWLVGWSPVSGDEEATMGEFAYPLSGGAPVRIVNFNWKTRWSKDMRHFYISVYSSGMDSGASGRTFVLPLTPGQPLPSIPPGGFRSEAELAAIPGARVINYADVSPGLADGTYAFSVGSMQRNLYRIPLATASAK